MIEAAFILTRSSSTKLPEQLECAECVRIGADWVHLRTRQRMRDNSLLRQLPQPARQQTCPTYWPPRSLLPPNPASAGSIVTRTKLSAIACLSSIEVPVDKRIGSKERQTNGCYN